MDKPIKVVSTKPKVINRRPGESDWFDQQVTEIKSESQNVGGGLFRATQPLRPQANIGN